MLLPGRQTLFVGTGVAVPLVVLAVLNDSGGLRDSLIYDFVPLISGIDAASIAVRTDAADGQRWIGSTLKSC